MCRITKLKFACKHTSPIRLSQCLGHRTETSIKSPGKVVPICKGAKGKAALKLRMSSRCPACIRRMTKHENEAVLNAILASSAVHLHSSDKQFREMMTSVREDATDKFAASMQYLDAHTPAAQRKVIKRETSPHSPETDEEESGQVEREKIQRKLDVIAQWNKEHAVVTAPLSCGPGTPVDKEPGYEAASSNITPSFTNPYQVARPVQSHQTEEPMALRPKLRLRITPPKKPEEASKSERKREAAESMEPSGDLSTPSDIASPRSSKRGRRALTRMVRAA